MVAQGSLFFGVHSLVHGRSSAPNSNGIPLAYCETSDAEVIRDIVDDQSAEAGV